MSCVLYWLSAFSVCSGKGFSSYNQSCILRDHKEPSIPAPEPDPSQDLRTVKNSSNILCPEPKYLVSRTIFFSVFERIGKFSKYLYPEPIILYPEPNILCPEPSILCPEPATFQYLKVLENFPNILCSESATSKYLGALKTPQISFVHNPTSYVQTPTSCAQNQMSCSEPSILCPEPNILCLEPNFLCSEPNILCPEPIILCPEPNTLCPEPNSCAQNPTCIQNPIS